MDIMEYDEAVFGKDYKLTCMFCGAEFKPDLEYPRSRDGEPRNFMVRISTTCGFPTKEVVLCGDLCPECRDKVDSIIERNGLHVNRRNWSTFLIRNESFDLMDFMHRRKENGGTEKR